jgi:hypothetical protein
LLDSHTEVIDKHLSEVVKKHEMQYLEAYNIYVKKKEHELHGIIQKMYDKNNNIPVKDAKIMKLEQ